MSCGNKEGDNEAAITLLLLNSLERRFVLLKTLIMLFPMSFYPNQGHYLRAYNQAQTLIAEGYQVTIIAWDRSAELPKFEEVDRIRVERIWNKAGIERGPLNAFRFAVFWLMAFVRMWRKRSEIDAVHCFNLNTMLPGWLFAFLKNIPAILDLPEPNYYAFLERKYTFFVRLVLWLERVMALKFEYVFVHNLYQVHKFKQYGIKRLAQIGSFPPASLLVTSAQSRSRNQHPDGTVVFGRIGTIYANNGIEETIEAFQKLLKTHPEARLMFAGRVFEHYKSTFETLVKPLGEKVEIIGSFATSQMPELYAKIDISIMVYQLTDWFRNITPTKFFDSLANGVPVIASDMGDLREIIEHCQSGILVEDPSDTDSICEVMRRLADDAALRLDLAENGLIAARQRFNWDLMEERLLTIYRKLLAV
jgi:glycosyltransferase involved in cell wall biosynthesis